MTSIQWSSNAQGVIHLFRSHYTTAGYISSPHDRIEEARLTSIIREPLPHLAKFTKLSEKWKQKGLTEAERGELLNIVEEREAKNADRAAAVRLLSQLRGVSFEATWKQMLGDAPVLIVPCD